MDYITGTSNLLSNLRVSQMAREDKEKTAFITPCGMYCYVCMPFGMKSAGATF
jgi:hypothetical protein